MFQRNTLITGPPGIGKTTLMKRLWRELDDRDPVGFYTEEIREGTARKGFKLISSAGHEGVLSHTDIKSPHRVGKYRVDLAGFESFLARLALENSSSQLVLVDEIGKMECFSSLFIHIMETLLESERCIVTTIAARGSGFIEKVKKRSDCELVEVNRENRDRLPKELAARIRKVLG
jgi:nucleoside-triphosphatase